MSQQSLFDQITSERTLGTAWKRVRKKGSAGGHDGVSVDAFTKNAGERLTNLREELLAGEYAPEPLREVSIPKGPHTRERRVLRLPSVRDKIVQQAARATLAPVLGKDFLNCSYGYRPGKGPQRAVRRVTHYLRHVKCRWVVAADIDDFFDSLDQERLLNRLQAALSDERVVQLITLFLKMGAVDRHGDWRDVQAGIGQGNAISPLLSNFYLHPFDVHLAGQDIGLVRYADDFVLLCRRREAVQSALARATDFLGGELGLRLNGEPRPVDAIEDGFTFLGVRFQGHGRRLSARKQTKMEARVRQWTTPPKADDFGTAMEELNESIVGWRRYYGTVLDDAALDTMSAILRTGWVRLVARAFERHTFKRVKDAKAALEGAEALQDRSGATQVAWIDGIIGEARSNGKVHTEKKNALV